MAVTIFGIVAITVYGTFARTLRSKRLAEEQAELTQEGRSAVARLADELASAFYPEQPPGLAIFRSLSGGTESMPLDSIIFTALSSRPAGIYGHDSDQRVISYFFPQRRDHGRSRSADRTSGRGPATLDLDADEAADFFAAFGARRPPILGVNPERLLRREAIMASRDALDTATPTAFLDDVASLALRFYNGSEWLEVWDSEDTATYRRLPRAVAIDLGLYDAAGAIQHFVTAVDLALADPRPAPRSSGAGRGTPTPAPASTPGAGRSL